MAATAVMAVTAVTRLERRRAALVCAAWAGAVLLLAGSVGALGISRNDDWVYYRVAFDAEAHGGFAPDPYTRAMLVGHVLLARPVMALLGPSMVALQVLGVVLAGLALWCTYLLLRGFLRPRPAALAVGTLALGPLLPSLAPTYMTDVPTFALQAVALLAAARATRGPGVHRGWFVVALLAAFGAFTVREYAAAAAVAVVVTAAWHSRRDARWVLLLGALWVAAAGALYLWRTQAFPGPSVGVSLVPDAADVRVLGRTAYTLALLVSPATLVVLLTGGGVRLLLRHRVTAVVAVVAAVGGTRLLDGVVLGNYVGPHGSYTGTVAGRRPWVIAPPLWGLVVGVAVVSAVVLAVLVVDALRELRRSRVARGAMVRPPTAGVLTLAYAVAYLALTLTLALATTSPDFDRYLMPVVPAVAAVVLWTAERLDRGLVERSSPGRRRLRTVAARGAVAALAVVSLSLVVTSVQFDTAKWRLGTELEAQGWSAPTVDAGFEWFGFHQTDAIDPHRPGLAGEPFWVARVFAHPRVCVRVSHDADPGAGGDVLANAHVWAPLGGTFTLTARPYDLDCPGRTR
ncbi:MAG: Dolichyl-phosphate-mannose-protein mannosyltransferase [Humibacillus sp.]|nr:Dolichyl-phosphate-mannose-protein mannosyltransferase [Humibacillus sp.]